MSSIPPMKTKHLATHLPLETILAYDDLGNPNLRPPDHVINVARIHASNSRSEVSDDVGNWVLRWATEQDALARTAMTLLNRLHEVAPVPTRETILAGTATWPTWPTTWWGETLQFPWAGRLAEAILEAEAWLERHG